ncbi:uncharacterized protein A1O5_10774 [Cladophialophora psammophila CBS 110553]|uniref:3-oxoacyl-[acyl-carrier protein] reductase n=1 Tax=Cladophialophora psammophila CBS 110553 TaxID=1182543 RepID=W9WDY4_9EURO|nr:uncharacterized protein A1O5_10774 [Cladophialophora psammophila CBS 110553]EXJ66158.1 hypothetical protein A1O5_10774 [Cladophialophora psammophila CBS 110553]
MRQLVALVTGAASGIGKATARKLASRGISVVLADMNQELGTATAKELRDKYNVKTQFHRVDVTKEPEVKDLIEEAGKLSGRLDYAANCAGIAETVANEEESITTAWFDKVYSVNARGVWLCQKYQARQMRSQTPRAITYDPPTEQTVPPQRGAIVNVISISGLVSMGFAAYTPSKYAAMGVTKTGAKFYGPEGIRVNGICPGWTITPMTNRSYGDGAVAGTAEYGESTVNKNITLGRMAFAEEQANVISFLLSDESSYMNGSLLVVDGGFHDIVSA